MPRVRGGDEAERQDEGGNPTVDVRHVFADRGHAPMGTRQAARRAPGWPLRAWRVRVRRNTRTDLTSRPRPETGKELKELSDGLTEIRDSGPAARGATLLALTNTAGSTLAGLCDWSFAAGLSPERVNGGAGADHRAVADGHARQDAHVGADPHVASDMHGQRVRVVVFAQDGQDRVAGGGDRTFPLTRRCRKHHAGNSEPTKRAQRGFPLTRELSAKPTEGETAAKGRKNTASAAGRFL